MRLVITDACVGHGVCETLAPDLFEVGDDGVSHVLVDKVPVGREEAAGTAVRSCPALAIELAE